MIARLELHAVTILDDERAVTIQPVQSVDAFGQLLASAAIR